VRLRLGCSILPDRQVDDLHVRLVGGIEAMVADVGLKVILKAIETIISIISLATSGIT